MENIAARVLDIQLNLTQNVHHLVDVQKTPSLPV